MFHFPEPGELENPSEIPISDEDAYWLLLASAPLLVATGESTGTEDAVNGPLLAWWNLMNGLDRHLARRCQKLIRESCDGALPPSPWEDVDPQGKVLRSCDR
jgi:hypothetical protein